MVRPPRGVIAPDVQPARIAAAVITIILMMDSPPLQIAAPPKRPNFGPLSRAIPVRATVAQTPLVPREVEVWKRFLPRPVLVFPPNPPQANPRPPPPRPRIHTQA